MNSFKTLREKMKDPCWKNYKMVGTKKKGDQEVPNCVPEEVKKGLYYYVNLRKKAGISRPASSPKAPSDQDWKDAAKTAKKENTQPDVSEEKQKGLDGKACWKGYKRMGTKMKGGKRVDNCVKVKYESKLAEKLANLTK